MAGYIGSKASVVTPGAERKKVFAITSTTTSLTGLSYSPGFVHVFHNGVRLVDGTDYTATNGTSITLTNAALNGDEVVVISYATYQNVDSYTKAEADGRYVNVTGDTMTGALDATNLTRGGSQVFSRDNILGTVSESSGVPTGAIIERGSNVNGEFVKYADGTMIAKTVLYVASSTTRSITLPATFASAFPTAVLPWTIPYTSNGSAYMVTNVYLNTTTSCFLTWAATSINESGVTAIGRWF